MLDHDDPLSRKKEFLAVNQLTIVENKRERRPDVVVFVNGLPLVVPELKKPAGDRG